MNEEQISEETKAAIQADIVAHVPYRKVAGRFGVSLSRVARIAAALRASAFAPPRPRTEAELVRAFLECYGLRPDALDPKPDAISLVEQLRLLVETTDSERIAGACARLLSLLQEKPLPAELEAAVKRLEAQDEVDS